MGALDGLLAELLRGAGRWPPGTNADEFLARAHLHGVSSLLHEALEAAPRGVPDPVRAALRAAAFQNAALELGVRAELERLLARFDAAAIRPLLLKGTPLAYTHYRQPALRERADADLLVRADRRQALFDLLETEGYRRADSAGGELSSAETTFTKTGSPLMLDVHWRIKTSPLLAGVLGFDELDAQAVAVAALGPHARAPAPVHAVLLAALHRAGHHQSPFWSGGVAHRGDRLVWLYDLHLLVPALSAGECAALAAHAARHRVAGLCRDALAATREAFGTALPAGLMDALARSAAQAEPSMALLHGGRRGVLLAELRALPWRDRGRWLRERVLPPGDYMLRKYGTQRRWLLPALYVRRALGWLAR